MTRAFGGAVVAISISACQAPLPKTASPPTPQLIHSDALNVPDACHPTGSVIVDFTVLENGATSDVALVTAPVCLQQALSAWVASFRYTPASAQMRTSIEWLLVEAKRGS
jgi:hypothetical protein